MTANRKAIWGGLIVCVMLASSCSKKETSTQSHGGQNSLQALAPGSGQGQQQYRRFDVHIYTPDPHLPKECYADLAAVTVWSGTHYQHVQWFSDDQKTPYKVDFGTAVGGHGSPFPGDPKDPTFSVPGNSTGVDSKVPVGSAGYYPYAIRNAHGDVCKAASDPGVYVK